METTPSLHRATLPLASTLATLALVAWLPAPAPGPAPHGPQEAPPGDVPPISALELPLDRLATWGKQEFTYATTKGGSRQTLGTVTLSTSVADGAVTLTDRFDLDLRGAPYWVEIRATGPLGTELRPEKLSARGTTDDGDGKLFDMQAEIGPTSANVTGGRTKSVQVPAGTLSDGAIVRLVTLLPRRAGVLARFEHFLDASEMLVNPGGTIACSGSESLEIDGASHATWRFDVTSDDRVVISAWVDGDGRLLKVVIDGTKEWLAKR